MWKSDLELEKYWVTQSDYLIFATAVALGVGITTSTKYCFFKFCSLLLELHGLEGMGKFLILFEVELLIPNFEEDMHVLMNFLHCTKILVLMPPENIFFQILVFAPLPRRTGRYVLGIYEFRSRAPNPKF